MKTTEEKFLILLKLLNDCRNKLYSLYHLFVANLQKSKENSIEMGKCFDEVMSCKNDLRLMANSSQKKSKLIIKSIKTKVNEQKDRFLDIYNDFDSALNDCIPLKDEYKKEVVMCCDTYKKMNKDGTSTIDKGYKKQVILIKKILEGIKNCVTEYNDEKASVKKLKESFDILVNDATDLVQQLS